MPASVSWPRVRPLGQVAERGRPGLYERLVDGLIARGIQPHLTLNHWDLPQALQGPGRLGRTPTVQHFVDHALGCTAGCDRVASITTHNEPWVVVYPHEIKYCPPRHCRPARWRCRSLHHSSCYHGSGALQALRAAECQEAGIAEPGAGCRRPATGRWTRPERGSRTACRCAA
jgi:beta-glucosidase